MAIQHLNSHITVRAYDMAFEGGRIMDSRKARTTEIDALQRMRWGDPIAPTDTIGEALREGKHLCPRCCQFKGEKQFAVWVNKKTNKKYRKRLCNPCRKAIEKARHYSEIEGCPDTETVQLYPTRFE